MITLQNHAPAPKVAVAAAAAASTGAPHASIGALPDGADFAALLGDQITLSAAATTTPAATTPAAATSAEDRRDIELSATPTAPAATPAAPEIEAALVLAASLTVAAPGVAEGAQAAGKGLSATTAPLTPPGIRVTPGPTNSGGAPASRTDATWIIEEGLVRRNEPFVPVAAQAEVSRTQAVPFESTAPMPGFDASALAANSNPVAQPALPHVPPSMAAPAVIKVDAPVGSDRWNNQLATHVVVLVRDGTRDAVIQVTPPELGPVRAAISVADGIASVVLSAPAHATREALDAALPALRDALAASGITLGESSVSGERPGQQRDRLTGQTPGEPGALPAGPAAQPAARRLQTGLLDLYA